MRPVYPALAALLVALAVSSDAHAKPAESTTPATTDSEAAPAVEGPVAPDEVMPKIYDEDFMAYDKEFAKKYRLPDKDIMEMPKYLHFIEMTIRTEGKKPICRLNVALDNDPIFAIPKEDYIEKRFDSAIKDHLRFLPYFRYVYDVTPPLIELGSVNTIMNNAWNYSSVGYTTTLIHDNNTVFVSAIHACPSPYVLGSELPALQVQKSGAIGKFVDIKYLPFSQGEFFERIMLPWDWIQKVVPTAKVLKQDELEQGRLNRINGRAQ